jgi:hypothetical protein
LALFRTGPDDGPDWSEGPGTGIGKSGIDPTEEIVEGLEAGVRGDLAFGDVRLSPEPPGCGDCCCEELGCGVY